MSNIDVTKAAKWWADQICGNKPHDNGDSGRSSVFACMLADMGREPVSDEQRKVFEDELVVQINKLFEEWGENGASIGCDYGPDLYLSNAADKAGINHLNFPFKTDMFFRNGVISVKEGYGQPIVELK